MVQAFDRPASSSTMGSWKSPARVVLPSVLLITSVVSRCTWRQNVKIPDMIDKEDLAVVAKFAMGRIKSVEQWTSCLPSLDETVTSMARWLIVFATVQYSTCGLGWVVSVLWRSTESDQTRGYGSRVRAWLTNIMLHYDNQGLRKNNNRCVCYPDCQAHQAW